MENFEFNTTDYKTTTAPAGGYPAISPEKNIQGNIPCEVEVDTKTFEVTLKSAAKNVWLDRYEIKEKSFKLSFGFINSFGKETTFNTFLNNPFNSEADKLVSRVMNFNQYTLSKLYEGLSGKDFPSFAFKTAEELLEGTLGTLTKEDKGNVLVEFRANKDGSLLENEYLNLQLFTKTGEAPDYDSWCSKEELDVNRILNTTFIYNNEYFKGVVEKYLAETSSDETQKEETLELVDTDEILGF